MPVVRIGTVSEESPVVYGDAAPRGTPGEASWGRHVRRQGGRPSGTTGVAPKGVTDAKRGDRPHGTVNIPAGETAGDGSWLLATTD